MRMTRCALMGVVLDNAWSEEANNVIRAGLSKLKIFARCHVELVPVPMQTH